jgi:monoamine oxidase
LAQAWRALVQHGLLADGGADVTVIEARDRIGGRTHTSHALARPAG